MNTSLSKQRLKFLSSLSQKKYRKINQQFLIEGVKICDEALHSDFKIIEFYLISNYKYKDDVRRLSLKCAEKGIPVIEISESDLKKISDTVQSQGVLALVCQPEFLVEDLNLSSDNLFIAGERLADPGNLGTIIRTADWFGVDAVFLDKESADWTSPKVLRSTMGSVFHVPVLDQIDLKELIPQLKSQGFSTFGASLGGNVIGPDFKRTGRKLLVVGNESHGLSAEISNELDYLIKIKRFGAAESLNVAVATGILLNEFCRHAGD